MTYTALSHVGGTEHKPTPIICNGQRIAIPDNLTETLHYLLKETSERYLWIDALCINQADNAEKAFQVRTRLRIFEKAKLVVAWVSGGTLDAECTKLDSNRCFHAGHQRECIQSWKRLCTNLLKVATDKLWSRTWCRQEIFAAKNLVLMGPYFTVTTLELGQFQSMLRQWVCARDATGPDGKYSLVRTQPRFPGDDTATFDVPATFRVIARHYRHAGTDNYSYKTPSTLTPYTTHWLQHLRDGSAFRVSNDRDRVHGIFGMVSSPTTRTYVESRRSIDPDNFPISYARSVSRVYQDLVKFLINTDKNLDCLAVFQDRSRSLSTDLPSWVTNWRVDQRRSLLAVAPSRRTDQKTYGLPRKQDLDDEGQLVLEGRVLFDIEEAPSPLMNLEQFAVPAPRSSSKEHVFGSLTQLDRERAEIGASYMRYNAFSKYTFDKATMYVPQTTRVGNCVALLKGARFPFVLRPLKGDTCELVGPALFGGPDERLASSLQERFPDIINLDGALVWSKKMLRTFTIG